jgi:dUTP pyrophosphatase
MDLPIVRLPHAEGLPLPEYAHEGDAGMDLRAAIHEPVTIYPSRRATIPCGFMVAIPNGWCMLVLPRSGLARSRGVTVANAPGLIDSTFRGECMVILTLHGDEFSDPFVVNRGDRIAQAVLVPFGRADLREVSELGETARGAGGFGSSGVA